ncbi:hypothetical protein BDQ17DRAFT_487279 [Cyathus striatus]|nr:hypothetical protein BDQ17DRAFT_487279 [Cyathus striatus]
MIIYNMYEGSRSYCTNDEIWCGHTWLHPAASYGYKVMSTYTTYGKLYCMMRSHNILQNLVMAPYVDMGPVTVRSLSAKSKLGTDPKRPKEHRAPWDAWELHTGSDLSLTIICIASSPASSDNLSPLSHLPAPCNQGSTIYRHLYTFLCYCF